MDDRISDEQHPGETGHRDAPLTRILRAIDIPRAYRKPTTAPCAGAGTT